MKKLFFAIVLCFLFLTLLPAQEKKDAAAEMLKNLQTVEKPEAVPARARAGFDSITAKDMMALMAFISSDNLEGREIGTRGYDTAAAYAQSLFTLWGLQPGGDMPRTAGGMARFFSGEAPAAKPERGYLQELALKEALESTAAIVLESGSPASSLRSRPFAPGVDFVFSSVVPLEVSAPLVFAGYGISEKSAAYDDLAAVDVKDKIVLILCDAPGRGRQRLPLPEKRAQG